MLVSFLALAQAVTSPATVIPQAPGDDIVVVARRQACTVAIAKRMVSDREFRAKAREWAAGRPVRVHVPVASSLNCEAQILFRLNRYGVTRAIFVEE